MTDQGTNLTTSMEAIPLPNQRKAGLALAGMTAASLARELGVSRAAVNSVILGHQRSRRIEYAIAKVCRRPVEELFPLDAA